MANLKRKRSNSEDQLLIKEHKMEPTCREPRDELSSFRQEEQGGRANRRMVNELSANSREAKQTIGSSEAAIRAAHKSRRCSRQ